MPGMKTFAAFLIVLSLFLAPAATATAQKGVLGTGADPRSGIVDADGGDRYTALPAGAGATTVARISTADGRVSDHVRIDQRLVVPSVAYDGSPSGLSADGDTLVLSEPGIRFPQERSQFAVLDTDRLRVVDRFGFDGTFTFDAISPDGRTVYLIEYTSPRDLSEYLVRAYDVREGQLDPEPILDPDESAEEMYGVPVNRVTSPDGRWAYTLYDGREHPFIHALDTERGVAVCIDLESLHRPTYGLTELEPSPDGATLSVVNGERVKEVVDLETFEVSPPPASEPAAPPADTSSAGDEGSMPVALIAAGALLLGAVALIAIRRRPGRVDEGELERLVELDRTERDAAKERDRETVG
jgi:hypothetical protein